MKRLVLPFPPSVNAYYKPQRIGNGARIVLRKEAREYRKRVINELRSVGHPLSGRLIVRVILNPPNTDSFDIDNCMKGLLDAMQHAGVFENDEQIDQLEIKRGTLTKGGSALVEIGVL